MNLLPQTIPSGRARSLPKSHNNLLTCGGYLHEHNLAVACAQWDLLPASLPSQKPTSWLVYFYNYITQVKPLDMDDRRHSQLLLTGPTRSSKIRPFPKFYLIG